MSSPIYNCSNFTKQPQPCDCKKCGQPTLIAQSKANKKWFTVGRIGDGQFVWHNCERTVAATKWENGDSQWFN